MTDNKQTNLFGLPEYTKGQILVTITDKSGGFKRFSDDNSRVQLEITGIDNHTSLMWFDLAEIVGYESPEDTVEKASLPSEQDTPMTPDAALEILNKGLEAWGQSDNPLIKSALEMACTSLRDDQKQIATIKAENTKLTEESEFDERKALIVERQHNVAIKKLQGELAEANIKAKKPVDPDEVLALRTTIKTRDNEIAELKRSQQRPPVEIKIINRSVNIETGTHDDPEIAKWFAEGWTIVPELSGMVLGSAGQYGDEYPWEHIIFRRDNKQPIRPDHPLRKEIRNAFDAQATPDSQIIKQDHHEMPYTGLLNQGLSADDIIAGGNNHARAKGQAAYNKSQASHPPLNANMNNALRQLTSGITITGSVK